MSYENRSYPLPSHVIKKNIELLTSREEVGLRKYGHTLDRTDLTHSELLQHGLEEALDLANYLQAAKMKIDRSKQMHQDLFARCEKIMAEERLNGVRSSTDVIRRVLEEMDAHIKKFDLKP